MNGNSRCFLVEATDLDVSSASKFGELQVVFPSERWRPSVFLPDYAEALVARLREVDYDPEVDFVVVAGRQLPLAVAMAAIGATYGKFRVLAFNAHGSVRDYEPLEVGSISVHAA